MELSNFSKALVVHDLEGLKHAAPNESSPMAMNQVQHGYEDPLLLNSKKLQDELEWYGSKIKEHEDNLKFLKAQKNQLDDSIGDVQVRLGKFNSSSAIKLEGDESLYARNDKDTLLQIMKYDKSAAGILCQVQAHQDFQNSSSILTQDVVGVVATLGQVEDDMLSRLLSEHLGLDTMLAIVCKSYDGVKALEVYDNEGRVNKCSGIHGLGTSIGRPLQADDPQRRLNITKPKLPNGEIPAGFLGFAVNMIEVDTKHLHYLTASGCGIRETLFYNLFSRLQVYRTRSNMVDALPCISDGAISLDGGMIKSNGIFSLGSREDVDLLFPKPSKVSDISMDYLEIEKQMKKQQWERERLKEDTRRVQAMLDQAKLGFQKKKQEFVKFLADSAKYLSQAEKEVNVSDYQ
ncbi:hypothetical protein V2J09_023926 [Rumex salicifolius]